MQSRFPSFLMLCALTLFVIFQHTLVKAAQAADLHATMPVATHCEQVSEVIALALGEPKAFRLSTRKEQSRWNARPDVLSVQAGPGNTHLLRGESPGQSELSLALIQTRTFSSQAAKSGGWWSMSTWDKLKRSLPTGFSRNRGLLPGLYRKSG